MNRVHEVAEALVDLFVRYIGVGNTIRDHIAESVSGMQRVLRTNDRDGFSGVAWQLVRDISNDTTLPIQIKDTAKTLEMLLQRQAAQQPQRHNPLALDVNADRARALHRIVRAMHDGNCPQCGALVPAEHMRDGATLHCRACGFTITPEEQAAALAEFAPFMKKNVEVFNQWRRERNGGKQ